MDDVAEEWIQAVYNTLKVAPDDIITAFIFRNEGNVDIGALAHVYCARHCPSRDNCPSGDTYIQRLTKCPVHKFVRYKADLENGK